MKHHNARGFMPGRHTQPALSISSARGERGIGHIQFFQTCPISTPHVLLRKALRRLTWHYGVGWGSEPHIIFLRNGATILNTTTSHLA